MFWQLRNMKSSKRREKNKKKNIKKMNYETFCLIIYRHYTTELKIKTTNCLNVTKSVNASIQLNCKIFLNIILPSPSFFHHQTNKWIIIINYDYVKQQFTKLIK